LICLACWEIGIKHIKNCAEMSIKFWRAFKKTFGLDFFKTPEYEVFGLGKPQASKIIVSIFHKYVCTMYPEGLFYSLKLKLQKWK